MMKHLLTLVSLSLLGTVAFADELPEAPNAEPAEPAEPPSTEPAAPAPATTEPVAPAPAATEPVAPVEPTPAVTPTNVIPVGSTIVDDGGAGVTASASPKKGPSIAFELSGAGAYVANPYVEYRGWTMENGAPKGTRLEVNLVGIQLAYELSSMSNTQACSDVGCVTGDFGSTTFHALDLGYRLRFSKLGPVRPFATTSFSAVRASAGDWSAMTSSKPVWGAGLRAGVGVEVPLAAKLFASATIAYRLVVTRNPLYDEDQADAQTILVGGDKPNGDFAEDMHLVTGYVGIGLEL